MDMHVQCVCRSTVFISISIFHIDTMIMIFYFHLWSKPPQWISNPTLRHFHPKAPSQPHHCSWHGSWHGPHLAAHLDMCCQVFLGAKSLGTDRAGVPSLFGVHRGEVPVQVRAVSEVLQTVHTLHQLLLEVNGLLVAVCIGLEGETGGALGAEVTCRRRLCHCRAVESPVVEERLRLGLVVGLGRLVECALHARPV